MAEARIWTLEVEQLDRDEAKYRKRQVLDLAEVVCVVEAAPVAELLERIAAAYPHLVEGMDAWPELVTLLSLLRGDG